MSFPSNTSPYGLNKPKLQASPQMEGNQDGGWWQTVFGKPEQTEGTQDAGWWETLFGKPEQTEGNQDGGWRQTLFGKPEQNYQQSTLGQEQQPLYQQLQAANMGSGAGGSFGASADYYRDLMSNDSQNFNHFAAPAQRQFNEQVVPGLAEQFAGMGSGGLSSSGFRNAAVGAGADLSERLGAMRASLRQQGAQGMQQLGQLGLGSYNENIHRPETYGLIGGLAQGAGAGFGKAVGNMTGGFF